MRSRSLGVTLLLGLACGGSGAELMNSTSGDPVEVPPWTCVPGETQPCDCAAELPGQQTCQADGAAWGECDCSPSAMSQGPQPTSTDTGTGSGTADSTATSTADSGPGESTTVDPSSSGAPDPTTSGGGSSTGGGSSSSG